MAPYEDEYTKYRNIPNMTSMYLNEKLGTEKMDKFYMFLQKTLDFHVMMEFLATINTPEILATGKEKLPDIWDIFDIWIKDRQDEYR